MDNKIAKVIATILACIPLFFLSAWIVMLLWNALVPTIFGLGMITFWQAAGLKILFAILLKASPKVDLGD